MPARRDQVEHWRKLHEDLAARSTSRHGQTADRAVRRPRARLDLIAPILVLLLVSVPVAIAAPGNQRGGGDVTASRGEGSAVDLGQRNPGSGGSRRETAIVARNGNGGLVVRPSNTAKGGRAISATCDNDGLESEDGCAVYVNKGRGAAASFRTQGSVPFAIRDTNNGTVRHLNADMVDGKHASELTGARGPAGPQGPQGAQGPQGEPATRLWATVNNSGTATAGSGVTGAIRVNEGTYNVTFDRDISGCARILSNGFAVNGPSAVAINATFHTSVTTANVVSVEVWEGEQPGSQTDTSFHLALFC